MKNRGFTLIEVLVAVIILGVGLLGFAGLQARTLSNNLSAYNRSQATQLAYDITDRIRSNQSVAANYLSPAVSTCPNNTDPCTACTSAILTCTPAQIAQKDLFEWNKNITAALPSGGIGTVTAVGGVYTVTISWEDDKDPVTPKINFLVSFRL